MIAINFERVFNHSPNPYMLLDHELRYVAANSAYLAVTGSRLDKLIGRRIFEVFPDDPGDPNRHSVRMLRASLEHALKDGQPDTLALIPYKVPGPGSQGVPTEERYWSATHTPILNAAGEVVYILQHTVDVTELQQLKRITQPYGTDPQAHPLGPQMEAGVLERARFVQSVNLNLEAERQHLHRLFEQAPGLICVLRGPDHVFEIANKAYHQWVGGRQLLGKPLREVLPEVDEQGYIALLDKVMATGEPHSGRQTPILLQRRRDAPPEEAFVDFVFQPISGPDGRITGIFVQGSDVTGRVHAENELQRYREHLEELVRERTQALSESETERRQAEAALHQAQKMESLGKLTGGVAHDFNNLLQVIHGNLQLIEPALSGNAVVRQRLKIAMDAVERGAKLSSQLLAFARRQPLEPLVVHLGHLLRNMQDMLQHAVGEGIELQVMIDAKLWNALVDPGQIENVLLNLAINARDAMAGEGKLTIEAGNVVLDERYAMHNGEVTPGDYVMLAISDTGCGIEEGLLERVFEPFFTTKAEGQGTGLGLSMVYGLIKQSNGHIKIYSEPREGTTIKLYLPRTESSDRREPEPLTGPIEGGTETILVVEDDTQVRELAVATLSELGYQVLKAVDAQSALAIIQSGLPIDLLFTDVVMPGPLRSPQLAERARASLPDIEVLFTSGYTENAIIHGGRLDAGVQLLSKPYRREDLARKIRHMLRNREQRLAAHAHPATDPWQDEPVQNEPVQNEPVRDEPVQVKPVQETPGQPGARPEGAERQETGPEALERERSVPEGSGREGAEPEGFKRGAAGGTATERPRLLLVEDDARIRQLASELIAGLGYAVVAVGDSETALRALAENRFDVLFSDISLPGMSGIDLACEAQRLQPTLRLILASGYGETLAGEAPDGCCFLTKPYTLKDIQGALGSAPARG